MGTACLVGSMLLERKIFSNFCLHYFRSWKIDLTLQHSILVSFFGYWTLCSSSIHETKQINARKYNQMQFHTFERIPSYMYYNFSKECVTKNCTFHTNFHSALGAQYVSSVFKQKKKYQLFWEHQIWWQGYIPIIIFTHYPCTISLLSQIT